MARWASAEIKNSYTIVPAPLGIEPQHYSIPPANKCYSLLLLGTLGIHVLVQGLCTAGCPPANFHEQPNHSWSLSNKIRSMNMLLLLLLLKSRQATAREL